MTASGDAATVSVFVRADVARAFAAFTDEIDRWWRHGRKYRIGVRHAGRLYFENGLGGRLFETFDSPAGPRTVQFGTIVAWDPPERFAFEWRGVNFAPNEKTLVEVSFTAREGGTLVTVRHSGWSQLRPDHPARHGSVGAAFSRNMGLWWGGLMSSYREYIARGDGRPQ